MNQDQLLSAARWIVTAAGFIAVSRGWTTKDQAASLIEPIVQAVGALAAAGSLLWGIFAHTDDAKLKAVTSMEDVALVKPKPNADPTSAVAKAAIDPNQPKVVR